MRETLRIARAGLPRPRFRRRRSVTLILDAGALLAYEHGDRIAALAQNSRKNLIVTLV